MFLIKIYFTKTNDHEYTNQKDILYFSISHRNNAVFSKAKPPIMGWSSWNNFRININEQMIKEQADALVSSGLYAAGYRYINIDDGYFGGRDEKGNLLTDNKNSHPA